MFLAITPLQVAGQVKVRGGFLSDSIRIGEQTGFYLSAHYPMGTTVLFPDSSFAFGDFEYGNRRFFATESRSGMSTDSTIYYLTTFALGPKLALRLPAYVVTVGDCTAYFSNSDTIGIVQLVSEVPDSISIDNLPLKETTAYHPVHFQLNIFVLTAVLVGVGLIAVAVWLMFGRRIGRYFAARRLRRRYVKFRGDYDSVVTELQTAFSRSGAESAISMWKKYMEDLESRPYTKMTSRETVTLLRDESLGNNLRAIDRAIYGHDNRIVEPLQQLGAIADQHFTKRLEELKHGK